MRRGGVVLAALCLISGFSCWAEDWEPVYHRNELVEEILFDRQGRPEKQRLYTGGELEWVKTYEYQERVITITSEDPTQKNPTLIDKLYLRSDGSLWKMEREKSSEALAWSKDSFWKISPRTSEISLFNRQGAPVEEAVFVDGEKAEAITCFYDEDDRLTYKDHQSYLLDQRETYSYNQDGQLVEYDLYKGDLLVLQSFYNYNDRGLLSERIDLGEGNSQSWSGTYNSENELQVEKYFENDLLSRIITHKGEERIEEIYGRGKPRLRVIYKGAEIISEEKID